MHKTIMVVAAFLGAMALAYAAEIFGDGAAFDGHMVSVNGTGNPAPGTTTCTLTAGSTDLAGSCAATATSGVAVTFGKAFATAPTCIVQDRTTASGTILATEPTTTTFVMGTTVAADKISWICVGKQGN